MERSRKDNIIGIVGGMGPQAGVELFNNLLANTRASTDQQHLPVILMSFPGMVVDRTLFLDGLQPVNPAFSIAEIIVRLEKAGANIIGMACNSSHAPEIFNVIVNELVRQNSQVKLLNMPVQVCKAIETLNKNARRVGVISTNGTYNAKTYENLLKKYGYEVVLPNAEFQNSIIHRMIYDKKIGLKANTKNVTNEVRSMLNKTISFFKENEADTIILGCTEISLALNDKVIDGMVIVDSTEILAKSLVREMVGIDMEQNKSEYSQLEGSKN